jgi:hypothetical protein
LAADWSEAVGSQANLACFPCVSQFIGVQTIMKFTKARIDDLELPLGKVDLIPG